MLLWTDIQNGKYSEPHLLDANYSLKPALYLLHHTRGHILMNTLYIVNCIALMLLTAFKVTCDEFFSVLGLSLVTQSPRSHVEH